MPLLFSLFSPLPLLPLMPMLFAAYAIDADADIYRHFAAAPRRRCAMITRLCCRFSCRRFAIAL